MSANVKWLGSISLAQVAALEDIFAVFGAVHWVIPEWLVDMRQLVVERDAS